MRIYSHNRDPFQGVRQRVRQRSLFHRFISVFISVWVMAMFTYVGYAVITNQFTACIGNLTNTKGWE